MYLRSDTWSAGQDVRSCSNCDRPATPETAVDFDIGPVIYSCSPCGQREAVSWRRHPQAGTHDRLSALVVEEVRVVEEPHIILGEH